MAKLLDCTPVGSLESIDPNLIVTVTLQNNVSLEGEGGSKVPALAGTWAAISSIYIVGIQFEYGPADLSAGVTLSSANKENLSWSKSDGIAPLKDYTIRYRAIGAGGNVFGPWSTPVTRTSGDSVAGDVTGVGGTPPPTVAAAPTLSIATTIAPDGTQLSIASSTWVPVDEAVQYDYQLNDGTEDINGMVTPANLKGLTVPSGKTYKIRVKGVSRTGLRSPDWSPWSSSVSAGGDVTPPGVITGGAADDGIGIIYLGWTNPGDADLAKVRLYRHTSNVPASATFIGEVTGSRAQHRPPLSDTTYYFFAETVDRSGNASARTLIGSAQANGRVERGLDALGRLTSVSVTETGLVLEDVLGDGGYGGGLVGLDVPLTPESVSETLETYLDRLAVYPEQWNANAGDGVTDATAAIQHALDTGRDVILRYGRSYKVTSGLTITTHYQRLIIRGELKAVGSFDIITVTGACRGVSLDVIIHAPDHVGGWAIKVANAERVQIRAYLVNVWGCLYVEQNNLCSVEWLYASCRGPGIKWKGDATKRSDLLVLKEVWIGIYNTTSEVWGLDWDGNCHSLEIKVFAVVNAYGPASQGGNGKGRGMICRNTAKDADPGGGHPEPLIARIGHLEFDYIYGDGVVFDSPAHDVDMQMPYIHSPLGGSCILVEAMDRSHDLRISGGYMGSFARYAIENLTPHTILMDGTTAIYNDAGGLGRTFGPVGNRVPRTEWDDNFYGTVSVGNPIFNFDANDTLLFSRAGDFLEMLIGGTRRFMVDVDGVQAGKLRVDANFYATLSGGNPALNFDANDLIGYDRAGNEHFFNIGGTKRLGITAAGLSAARYAVDANGYLELGTGTVVLNFDSSDYIDYARSTNTLSFVIGATARLVLTSSALTANVPVNIIDANHQLTVSAGFAYHYFDTSDGISYERSTNTFRFFVGGSTVAGLTSSSFTILSQLHVNTVRVGSGLDFWLTVEAAGPRMLFDTNDYLSYNRAGNYYEFLIGSVQKLAIDGDGVKAPGFRVDDNLRLYLDSTFALLRFDANDVLLFDRTNNALSLEIGTAPIWKSTATQFEFMVPTKHKDYTVATLPTGAAYMRAFVSDHSAAPAPAFGVAPTGGGSIKVPVYHDGVGWKVG